MMKCILLLLALLHVTTASYFIILTSEPGTPAADREQKHFLQQAKQTGIVFKTRATFNALVNAISIDATGDQVAKLATFEGVKRVMPSLHGSVPQMTAEKADPAFTYPHSITGVEKVRTKLKLTGKGIKVGIVDTGVDYTHPSLGGCFGKGCKVAYGYDFVDGDDDPRDTCAGHGTHVAGIVAAIDKDFTGVAPDVTLGVYRVLGCAGEGTSEQVLAALERAHQDGMDVISLSLGFPMPWKDNVLAAATDKLAEKGVVVVAAAGNDGTQGLWHVDAPAVGSKTLAVASFDATRYLHAGITVDGTDVALDFNMANQGNEEQTLPKFHAKSIVYLDELSGRTDCTDYEFSGVNDKVVMMDMGDCIDDDLVLKAQNAGAFALLAAATDFGVPDHYLDGKTTLPLVGITLDHANKLHELMATRNVTLSYEGRTFVFDNPAGGKPAESSSWGPGAELDIKPDLAAVGGLVYSTFPVNLGSYRTWSGTSMATPYIAAAVALYLQAKGKVSPQRVMDAFKTTAQPESRRASSPPISVFKQGTGMVHVYDAIRSTTTITPSRLALLSNDIMTGKLKSITITNTGKYAQRYLISHVPAMAVQPYANGTLSSDSPLSVKTYAQVDVDTKDVTLQPGQSTKINLFFKAPKSTDSMERLLLSGYIKVSPKSTLQDVGKGFIDHIPSMSIPYGAMYGSYKQIRLMDNGNLRIFGDSPIPLTVFSLDASTQLEVRCRTNLPAKSLQVSVVYPNHTNIGPIWSLQPYMYLPRLGMLEKWVGTYAEANGTWTQLSPGKYQLKAHAQQAFTNEWEESYSKVFEVVSKP